MRTTSDPAVWLPLHRASTFLFRCVSFAGQGAARTPGLRQASQTSQCLRQRAGEPAGPTEGVESPGGRRRGAPELRALLSQGWGPKAQADLPRGLLFNDRYRKTVRGRRGGTVGKDLLGKEQLVFRVCVGGAMGPSAQPWQIQGSQLRHSEAFALQIFLSSGRVGRGGGLSSSHSSCTPHTHHRQAMYWELMGFFVLFVCTGD